jgi:hypothetical protein
MFKAPTCKTALITVGLGLLIFGCNNKAVSNPAAPSSSPHSVAQASETVYTCPMHPDITGKAGEDCPKCGMELVPKGGPATAPGQIEMRFSADPDRPKPNENVSLVLTPVSKEQPQARIDLEVEHTKKIHLIIVNDDLSWFDHIHPAELTDGTYRVLEKFPAPGAYTLFADYKPTGGEHKVDRFNLEVSGDAPAAKAYEADRLTSDAGDGFTAVLTPEGGQFLTGQPSHLEGKILKNGKELDVNTLEDYLGTKAHMVVIGLTDKNYLHVHPGVEGSTFDLHTTFENPGIYRGWLQFQSANKIYTSDFVFRVHQAEASAAPVKDGANGHQDH